MITRRILSRIVSIALCLLLCFSLSLTALAEGTCQTGTASVTDASASAASVTESAQTAAEQENTVQSATLILATGTWWRIFLTAFCGSFLAGLVLRGFTLLTDAMFKGKKKSASSRKARYADDPDEDENDSILTDGLWGDDDES